MEKVLEFGEYIEQISGVFASGNLEAIPFNHWKRDFEWLVMILGPQNEIGLIPVHALTPREACTLAMYKFNSIQDKENE